MTRDSRMTVRTTPLVVVVVVVVKDVFPAVSGRA
jgi:hypothetical protein